jgi:hypothetical protein
VSGTGIRSNPNTDRGSVFGGLLYSVSFKLVVQQDLFWVQYYPKIWFLKFCCIVPLVKVWRWWHADCHNLWQPKVWEDLDKRLGPPRHQPIDKFWVPLNQLGLFYVIFIFTLSKFKEKYVSHKLKPPIDSIHPLLFYLHNFNISLASCTNWTKLIT